MRLKMLLNKNLFKFDDFLYPKNLEVMILYLSTIAFSEKYVLCRTYYKKNKTKQKKVIFF